MSAPGAGEVRFEDMPPSIRLWLVIEWAGSIEAFMAKALWLRRIEPTPERIALGVSALEGLLAEEGVTLPTEDRAALRAYRANGNRW